MERIASFTIDHLKLLPGLYVSRRDRRGDCAVTTFDLRLTAPNREPVVDMPALHTIEHMAATYLRSSGRRDEIVYFGPMGCRTGFYLLTLRKTSDEVKELIKQGILAALALDEIPGATRKECGNYLDHDLPAAKEELRNYLALLSH